MTRKQIGQNTDHSSRSNLSGPELDQLSAAIGSPIEVDVAKSKDIVHAIINTSNINEFVIVSKPIETE